MKKSCIEGVTAEQAGSLSIYESDVIFFLLVSPVMVRYCVIEMIDC